MLSREILCPPGPGHFLILVVARRALAEPIIILTFLEPVSFLGKPWLEDFETLVLKSQNQYREDDIVRKDQRFEVRSKTKVSKN